VTGTGGRVLGVDLGSRRIGLAASDPSGILASPHATLERAASVGDDHRAILDAARDLGATRIVVGLPRSLSGGEGPAAGRIREVAADLARRVSGIPLRFVDERFTTVTAERVLREQGRKGSKRRAVVDQAAAVVILQHALDSDRAAERETGSPPGSSQ
jgi:putative Holliday junction resolvase